MQSDSRWDMKTPLYLKVTTTALFLCLWAVGLLASAQAPAELDIQLYASLTMTGAVGTVYSIKYVTGLAQTNNASAWRCLEFLQLPASPDLWADKSAPGDREAVLPGGGDASPNEHGVHPAGDVPDGQPDERGGPLRR